MVSVFKDNPIVPVVVALIFGMAVVWQIYCAARRSTRLAIALGMVGLAFFGYAILMVEPIAFWLDDLVGIKSISVLLKDVLLAVGLASCLITWRLWRATVGMIVIGWSALTLMVFVAFTSWNAERQLCGLGRPSAFDDCAHNTIEASAAQTIIYAVLIGITLATLLLLRPIAGISNPGKIACLLLLGAIAGVILWGFVATLGVWDVYRTGELGALQYALRTPIGFVSGLLCIISAIYLPVSRWVMALTFRKRAHTVLKALNIDENIPVIAGGEARYTVTDVMDALGKKIQDHGIRIAPSDANASVEEIVSYLNSETIPAELSVPTRADTDAQRSWILKIARSMEARKEPQHVA